MRYIIFSDLHSNLEALESFIRCIGDIDHDKIVCLGDMVGYMADPNPCVDWIRENCDITLAGNHDYAVVKKTNIEYFNSYAFHACVWTRGELTDKNKKFLVSLQVDKVEDGVHWTHASPFEPLEWHYVRTLKDGKLNFPSFETQLCFLGHSHIPLVIERNGDDEICSYIAPKFELEDDCRYLVNVGSLGQPRDGNPEPSFVVYDSGAKTIEFCRFSYDYGPTQEKILKNNLPSPLADRLSLGQ